MTRSVRRETKAQTKVCAGYCRERKELRDFYFDSTQRDGRQSTCKSCAQGGGFPHPKSS